jgi:hypothetical protein
MVCAYDTFADATTTGCRRAIHLTGRSRDLRPWVATRSRPYGQRC